MPVKSAFFKYGLQILSHREAVIRAATEVTVRISCPPFKAGSLAFTFTLSAGDGREEYRGVKLNRYGMQEMVDNVSFFTLRPPEPGSYRLIIYAKDLDVHSKEGVYGGVCEYELIWDGVSPQPFPPCVHTSWVCCSRRALITCCVFGRGPVIPPPSTVSLHFKKAPFSPRFKVRPRSNSDCHESYALLPN